MFDAFTKVVAQADARGQFISTSEIDALAAVVSAVTSADAPADSPPPEWTKCFSDVLASCASRAFFAASLRTWMCFVKLTTNAKSSRALPSMTPRLFHTNNEDNNSAREKICESSVCVLDVLPKPSVSMNNTVKPSGNRTGSPHNHKPFVHAFTEAPT